MIYVVDWGGHHAPLMAGLLRFLRDRGHGVSFVGTDPRSFLPLLAAMSREQVDHVFLWNGSAPGCEEVKRACHRYRVGWTVIEVGWFPQMRHIHFDRAGVNAASSLVADSLRWVTMAMMDRLAAVRASGEFTDGFRHTGRDQYVLCPLQLEDDTNVLLHSPFRSMVDFVDHCRTVFAGHHVIFKAHPKAVSVPMPGVEMVRDGSFCRWAADARLVYGINSTSLLEAALMKVPVAGIGNGLLAAHIGDLDRLLAALLWLQCPIDSCDIGERLARAGVPVEIL